MYNKIDIRNVPEEKLDEIDLDTVDLELPPPELEPHRQYYYIAKCRTYVRQMAQELGRVPFLCTQTFGCQMNARDSEKLEGILEKVGYQKTEHEEEADFVIYNTCTVRENANQRVYGRLGYLGSMKKKKKHMMIALCGCMMQEPQVVEKLKKSYRFVDLIFGTHNIFKFAELLCTAMESDRMVIDIWKDTTEIVENLPVDRKLPNQRKYRFKSGVNIMFGCNNFCSYCIVPYVRGRERSRNPEDILHEVKKLVADGVVEIMLLGQNVNSYGKNLEQPVTFAQLLEQLEQMDYNGALESFEAALVYKEDEQLIYRGEGLANMGLGDYETATECFLNSISYADGNVTNLEFDTNYYLASAILIFHLFLD